MKRYKPLEKSIGIFLLCTLLIITQTACMANKKEPVSQTQYDLLNTTCTITIYNMEKSKADKIIEDTFSLCVDYEKQLSKTIEGSDIDKINKSQGQLVMVSPATATLIQKGLYFGDISQGKFDITVGKLSNLWNFSSETPKVPLASEIEAAVSTIDYTNVGFESSLKAGGDEYPANIWLENPSSELDLGGIAKGYIADKAGQFLIDNGVEQAIVNLGGNIVAIGEKDTDTPWNIGIEKPFTDRREVIGSIPVKNKTVVTSGIYERMFEENGVFYHHILDVSTGYPMETDVEAVTLVGELGMSMDCDALSTICLMLGMEKGLELIENTAGVEALFIGKDGSTKASSGMEFEPVEIVTM